MNPTDRIPALVGRLYAIVAELHGLFPGRRFTPDGHLVGSLGEVLAAHRYRLRLLPNAAPDHDAIAQDGRRVQIKATQVDRVGMRSESEHLLVLRLGSDGSFEVVYNGPGKQAWAASGPIQPNGQRTISVSRLQRLMAELPEGSQLPTAAI